jgi:hypothetical protein
MDSIILNLLYKQYITVYINKKQKSWMILLPMLYHSKEKYSNYLGENKHDASKEDGEKDELQS